MTPITKASDLLLAKPIIGQLKIDKDQVFKMVAMSVSKACMQTGTEANPTMIELMAEDLIDCYKYDSIEDIQEALKKGRQGRYGKIYGKLNGVVLAEWMGKHLEEKAREREIVLSQDKQKKVEGDIHEEYVKLMSETKKPRTVTDILKDADSVINKHLKK